MQEIALKAITFATIGILIVAVLMVLLVALRKEINGEKPLSGLVIFGLGVLGLWAFVALAGVYFHLGKIIVPHSISQHLDTVFHSHADATTQ
jgi:hypothetical protein